MADTDNRFEIRKLRRLLREISDLAQHASLTGSLSAGAPSAIRRYNAVVQQLEQFGAMTPGFFQILPDNCSFDELGVESKLLAGYLKEDPEDMHPFPPDPPHPHVVIGMGGMKELEELKGLGKMIREQLPGWMRGEGGGPEPKINVHVNTEADANRKREVETRLAEANAKFQAAAERLGRGDLTAEQRAELIEELTRLGQEQAELARQQASS